MPKKQSAKRDEQSKLFKEKARELGADKPVNVDDLMKRLAGQKRHTPPPRPKKRTPEQF